MAGVQPVRSDCYLPILHHPKKLGRWLKSRAQEDKDDSPLLLPLVQNVHGKKRHECLVVALTNGKIDPNFQDESQMSALHHVAKEGDVTSASVLVVFGANVNQLNGDSKTPLDLAYECFGPEDKIVISFQTIGGQFSSQLRPRYELPRVPNFPMPDKGITESCRFSCDITQENLRSALLREAQERRQQGGCLTESLTQAMEQERTLEVDACDGEDYPYSNVKAGARVLCLDGGGIRGLIQVEILIQLEKVTKRKITELFDWIIGTSIGGLIALALAYTHKSLAELRQMFFQMKDSVFSRPHFVGIGCNDKELEKQLQELFGEVKMSARIHPKYHPKVLIAAVNKTKGMKLELFNNCFTQDYKYPLSDGVLVRDVARYTSAAPICFTSRDGYLDGGLMANNPSNIGYMAIRDFLSGQGEEIALLLSVGTGVCNAQPLGDSDLQKYVYMGPHLVNPTTWWKGFRAFTNFLQITEKAVTRSEMTDMIESQTKRDGVAYFRFSPELNPKLDSEERDSFKIIKMLVDTTAYMHQQSQEDLFSELVQVLHQIATNCRFSMRLHEFGIEYMQEEFFAQQFS